MPAQQHSPLRLHWVKSVCMFRCNMPPALLAECPGSFMCHCGNTGVERTPNKKFLCQSCQDLKLQPFDHESGTLPTSYLSNTVATTCMNTVLFCLQTQEVWLYYKLSDDDYNAIVPVDRGRLSVQKLP